MKIRTEEQIYDFTFNELAWRKKELYSLRLLVYTNDITSNKKNALLRSIITITYAHWEGFIKATANVYIQYVSMQRLKNYELAPNFLALSIKPILNSASQRNYSLESHIQVVNFFLNDLSKQSSVCFKNSINTKSNLSSNVLRDIVKMLGLDYSIYETKEKFIDEKLLKTRNQIAHGEYQILSDNEVIQIEDDCINLMEKFKNQIDNAVSLKSYKKH